MPAIVSLRRRAWEIRSNELRRAQRKLDRLGPRERRLVESLTAQIVNKLLHEPTVRMKSAGSAGPAYAGAVQHLFALAEEER
jgi:glutamyl-tRNA reductase